MLGNEGGGGGGNPPPSLFPSNVKRETGIPFEIPYV